MVLILRSPIDNEQLKADIGSVDAIQFRESLLRPEYELLARLLEAHPQVTLRAFGFDPELTTLGFLHYFPHLRRLHLGGLHELRDIAPLNALPDLEVLTLGETKKAIDLRPLTVTSLKCLGIVGHSRGLPEVLTQNPGLRTLWLERLKHDQVLAGLTLPQVELLTVQLGSADNLDWLTRFPKLRYLVLSRIKGIDDAALAPVGDLEGIEWLWLNNLAKVTRVPDLSKNQRLTRLDLDYLTAMRDQDALSGAAAAPKLQELTLSGSALPIAAIETLRNHPALSQFSIGTGNMTKNQVFEAVLGLPWPAPPDALAESIGRELEDARP